MLFCCSKDVLSQSQSLNEYFSTFYSFDIDNQFHHYLIDATRSIDGNLLVTGYTETEEGDQAFIIKVNIDGKLLQHKVLGETDKDSGVGIAEDNHGRMIIAWNSKDGDRFESTQPRLMLLDHNGDMVWKIKMDKGYSSKKAIVKGVRFNTKGNQIICFGIKNNTLWSEQYSIEGTRLNKQLIKKKIKDLEIPEKQTISILDYKSHYYIYCAAHYGDKVKKPLVVKLDSKGKYEAHASFSDHPIKSTGAIVVLDNNYFGMVGTTFSQDSYMSPKEDVLFLKVNKSLEKNKGRYPYQYKVIKFEDDRYHHSNDFGISLLPLDEGNILIAANTKSHKRNANYESIALFDVNENGIPLDKKPRVLGEKWTEQVKKMILMPDNSIWVVGQHDIKHKRKIKPQIFGGVIKQSFSKSQLIELGYFEVSSEIFFDEKIKSGYLKIAISDIGSPETVTRLKMVANEESKLIEFLYPEIPIAALHLGDTLYKSIPFKLTSFPKQSTKIPVRLEIVNHAGEILKVLKDSISIPIPGTSYLNEVSTNTKQATESSLKTFWKEYLPNDSLLVRSEKYELNVTTISEDSLEVADFFIQHNGKTIQPSGIKLDEVELISSENNVFKFKAILPLTGGKNNISVIVDNGTQVDSTKEIVIDYISADKSILWIMSIGINDKSGTTSFSQKDAANFANLFKNQADFLYAKKVQQIITDKELTTAEEIVSAINELAIQAKNEQIEKQDVLILFISGHGFIASKKGRNQFKIKGSNYDERNKKYTSFYFKEDVLEVLEMIPCSKLIFIDACKSGNANLDISEINTTNMGILTSCQVGESSYEYKSWENGALTKVITELFSNLEKCLELDTNKDSALSMEEVFPTIQQDVRQLVKEVRQVTQTPLMISPTHVNKIPFFIFKNFNK